MTNSPTPHVPNSRGDNTVLIVAGTVVGVVVVVAITAVAIAIEDGARAASMIALIVGPLATLLAFLGLFVKVQSLGGDVAKSLEQTTELTNGLGDAKFRAAVADVLHNDLIDPAVHDQLARDRARRRAATEAAAALVLPLAFPEDES